MTRKYVRVELSKLRELQSLLRDPVQFARDHDQSLNRPASDESDLFNQHRARAFSIGWAGSAVDGMLRDAGEPALEESP